MPSPFPGMDPYLEQPKLWSAFQTQLLRCVHQILLPGLVDRYRTQIQNRLYAPGEIQEEAGRSHPTAGMQQIEEYIEIRHRDDGRLVTLIEVVSPANKTTPAGRAAYLEKRKDAVAQRAGVVEIDLVLQGQPTLTYCRDGLPEYDYAVTVTRATAPDRYELYTATLQKRLPKFKIPLAPEDRDALMDLQATVTRAYNIGGFADQIDYRADPPVPLNDQQRLWLDELLRGQGLRGGSEPAHEEVAMAAYFLWQQEGSPPGRDEEFWFRAIEELRRR